MGINITSMIFTILSFFATGGLTLTLFWIERKNQKRRDKEELEQKARDFINRNIDELAYLSIAQLAVYLNPHVKHCRKIYNEFNRIYSNKLRQEILKQANIVDLNLNAFDKDILIDRLLELFEQDAQKLQLMTRSFLYDGAKYFHRGFYDWGSIKIAGNFDEDKRNKESENNYFEKKYYFIDKNNNYYRREGEDEIWFRLLDFVKLRNCDSKIEYYDKVKRIAKEFKNNTNNNIYFYKIPNTFLEFQKMHTVSPLDWYWILVSNASEEECTYIVMEMILQATYINKRELYNKIPYAYEIEGGCGIERNEDLYYSALLNLYCTYADKI